MALYRWLYELNSAVVELQIFESARFGHTSLINGSIILAANGMKYNIPIYVEYTSFPISQELQFMCLLLFSIIIFRWFCLWFDVVFV